VVERLRGATIAITNKVPLRAAHIARNCRQLKMVAICATGTDNVDLEACRARGIVVSNIRNYSLVSVPEHVFTLMLALRRNLRAYTRRCRRGVVEKSTRFCLLDHPIADLAGSRWASSAMARWAQGGAVLGRAFGMQVCVTSRSPVDDAQVTQLPLDELLRTSRRREPAPAAHRQTRHMMGAARAVEHEAQRAADQHRARRPGGRGRAGAGLQRWRDRRRGFRRAEQGAAGAGQPAAASCACRTSS
jgi:glycerate dehydrogenase